MVVPIIVGELGIIAENARIQIIIVENSTENRDFPDNGVAWFCKDTEEYGADYRRYNDSHQTSGIKMQIRERKQDENKERTLWQEMLESNVTE